MTSLRQLEANRRNALNSTGPKTDEGKKQSRRNALRHGFTAETVIEPLEQIEEYQLFEQAIVSEYLPQTPVERELVHRLASLFWRLRRATSIETGLLRIQSEIVGSFRSSRPMATPNAHSDGVNSLLEPLVDSAACDPAAHDAGSRAVDASRAIAVSYLRLANLDNETIDRLSRYEACLWRQVAQTLFTLQNLIRR
jgi:hypothetical protein